MTDADCLNCGGAARVRYPNGQAGCYWCWVKRLCLPSWEASERSSPALPVLPPRPTPSPPANRERELLEQTGKPYIIENVAGARFGAKGLIKRGLQEHGLKAAWLCGGMFGLPIYRHRYFETNWFWPQPGHPKHRGTRAIASSPYGAASTPGQRGLHGEHGGNGAQASGVGVGHAVGWRVAAEAMGIDWMKREQLTQASPPAMTRYIGMHLLTAVAPEPEKGMLFS